MKTTYSKIGMLAIAIGASSLLYNCSNETPVEEAEDVASTDSDNPDSLCYANPSWFPHSQTPAPEEGVGSPFDVSSTTNKIFHQWSWQKFLWLTKPDQGGNPLFLTDENIQQVTDKMQPVAVPSGSSVVLTDIKQAGPNEALLQANPRYASPNNGGSETVYYSIHMNATMFGAGMKFAQEMAEGTLPEDNFEMFPVGSFELKVSWINVYAIPDNKRSDYYTTMASLSNDGGQTFSNVEVALLGMHVVGVVQNHPEFIWATFEHDDLGPVYDWSTNSVNTPQDQLFFATGAVSGIDGIVYNKSTALGVAPFKVFDLFQFGVPRSPGGDFMKGTSQKEPENFNNIQGINDCVAGNLNDVWNNYFYNGSIWLNTDSLTPKEQAELIVNLGFKIGSARKGASARGSLNNANITMETFTQTFKKDIGEINLLNLTNCFSCHSGNSFSGNTSPIYLSHVFDGYLNSEKGMTDAELEELKLKHEKLTFGK